MYFSLLIYTCFFFFDVLLDRFYHCYIIVMENYHCLWFLL